MNPVEREIEEMVHRETRAWDAKDADLLLAIFHPDMVWPWPLDPDTHDPARWVMELGRYDAARWRRAWQKLFDTHALVHNRRRIVRIVVSREGDGGLAVVDVDTLWRDRAGRDSPWKGRAGKVTRRSAASGGSSCTPAFSTTVVKPASRKQYRQAS